MHKYGKYPYGRLHRDMLEIALDETFSRSEMATYSWITVNVNQWTGELEIDPTVEEAALLLGMEKRNMQYILSKFHDLGVYVRERKSKNMKGNAPNISLSRRDVSLNEKIGMDAEAVIGPHPIANLVFGRIPREFVRVAVEEKFKKTPFFHFWYISLNVAPAGHLTRIDDVPELAEKLKVSTHTLLRSAAILDKTKQFTIKKPSHMQGIANSILAADKEAADMVIEKEYKKAEDDYIRLEAKQIKRNLDRRMHPEEEKEMRRFFRQYFEETGELMKFAKSTVESAKERSRR